MRELRTFQDILLDDLKDPEIAQTYLTVALEEYEKDKDSESFLLALRDVAKAQGGITLLAQKSRLNRQNLYKALSRKGNPKLDTVGTVLHSLGFKLSIAPIQ